MTDAELVALEKRVSGPFKSQWRKEMYYEAKILELIAELRQAKAERDWLANKLDSIEWPLLTTWIEAAKEATCQKN